MLVPLFTERLGFPLCWRAPQVIKVPPLKGKDPARLLVSLKPRPLRTWELGLKPETASHSHILDALERHPMMQKAEGHPGTLVRCPRVERNQPRTCFPPGADALLVGRVERGTNGGGEG